jgi:DNA-binding transcriptional regulator GbsR (MarR family)
VVELFVHIASLIGLPRSVGELYGYLFISRDPLPMDALMANLGLSKGATSQGLRLLKSFGAVRTVYVPGERRDHFTAERELRKLVSGFVREEVIPHLESGGERLEAIRKLLDKLGGPEKDVLQERVERLGNWHSRSDRLLPLLLRLIQT